MNNEGIYAQGCRNLLIDGNTIFSGADIGIELLARDFGGQSGYRNKIMGNYIYTNGGAGVYLNADGALDLDQNVISNNIIWNNTGWGVNISNNLCDRNLVVGNIIYNNTAGNLQDLGTATTASGNIVA
jgi:parallel beta-helix repeat protein